MNLTLFVKIILIMLLASLLPAQENFVVQDVDFTGNETFDDGRLAEYMSTYSIGFFTKLFSSRTDFYYSRELAQADAERLRRFYQQQGFLNADVSFSTFDVNREDQETKVRFQVTENDPILVESVQIHFQPDTLGALGDSIRTRLLQDIKLKSGVRFRDDHARTDRTGISNEFVQQGYPFVGVNSNLNVDTTRPRVSIHWRVRPNQRARFGSITVKGNTKLADKSIRRQLTFQKGDMFNPEKINASQRRLYDLGVYNVVTVRADLSERRPSIPVYIELQASSRFTSKVGAGYGREEEFRTFLDFQFLNLTGGARRLHVYFRHSALEPYNAKARFVQSAFLTPTTTFTLNPFLLRQTEPAFTVNRAGANIILSHQFGKNYTMGSVYAYENVQLDEKSVSERNIDGLVKLYNKSSIALNLTHNTTDMIMAPTRGSYKSILLKYSGLGGGNYRYTKTLFDLRKYQRIGRPVLALRAQIGNLISFNTPKFIPLEERFYAGGSQSVRGWGRFQLGPMDDDGIPVGGRGLFVGSVELRTPISKSFSIATFLDMGNVWRDQRNINLNDLRYAAGIGVRYSTPIGPIRVDFAHPVWDTANQLQIHFSVGEAF